MLPILKRAAMIVGNGVPNYSELARQLKVQRPALYSYRKIPDKYCLRLFKLMKGAVSLHEIRSDIYPKGM